MSDGTLIFLHIPKTAGTTFQVICGTHYQIDETCRVVTPHDVTQFERLSIKRRQQVRLLMGHVYYGIHSLLSQPCTYLTLLREPVDRVMSHYYYAKRGPTAHPNHYTLARDLSLKKFVTTIGEDLSNVQTKILSGAFTQHNGMAIPMAIGKVLPSRVILKRAIYNLRSAFIFGITERLHDSMQLFRYRLDWGPVVCTKRYKMTKDRPQIDDLSEVTLHIIRAHNRLDTKLYHIAAQLFQEQLRELPNGGISNYSERCIAARSPNNFSGSSGYLC